MRFLRGWLRPFLVLRVARRQCDATHAQFAPELLDVDRLAFVGKGRIAGDHECIRDPRQIRRQALGEGAADPLLRSYI